MILQIRHGLFKNKHLLSLWLFILLNGLSSVIALFFPFYSRQHITLPLILIILSSIAILGVTFHNTNRLININITAFFYGFLWASQIIIKSNISTEYQYPAVMVILLLALLIATLSFIHKIYAFLLYCLPIYFAVFWLDNSKYGLWLMFISLLPILGITVQYHIQKSHAEFTQRLMNKFQKEKKILNDLSMLDPLTGLYNRRGFQNCFDNIIAQEQSNHFILLLDIDYFKSYNDHYGHSMGDQALMRVSAAIRDAVRATDVVARYGGEEFLVMLTDIQSTQALQTAERIRKFVYDLHITHKFNHEQCHHITISLGITPLKDNDLEHALLLADQALYKAKNNGRNKILFTEMFDLQKS